MSSLKNVYIIVSENIENMTFIIHKKTFRVSLSAFRSFKIRFKIVFFHQMLIICLLPVASSIYHQPFIYGYKTKNLTHSTVNREHEFIYTFIMYLCIFSLIYPSYFYSSDLSYGRGSTFSVKGSTLPKISNTPAWDGKDAEVTSSTV